MHGKLQFISLLVVVAFSLAKTAVITQKKLQRIDKTPWGLTEALYGSSGLISFNGTWITDEEFYYTASDKSIHKYNVAEKKDSIFIEASFLNTYSDATFTVSPNHKKVLVRHNLTEVFRHSYVAQYDIYDIEKDATIQVHLGQKLQYCGWSPLSDRLAYVHENNVYVHFNEDHEVVLTNDGLNGMVYNGVPDWVYEEEVLSSGSAIWWSTDGSKLAVGFFNDTKVQTFKYFLYGNAESSYHQYPEEVDLKYPKSGTANPVVNVKVYDLSSEDMSMERIFAPIDIVSSDHILQNVVWVNSSHLFLTWMNRRQNVSTLQSCIYTGVCVEVKRLEEINGWITLSKPICLSDGLRCIFSHWIGNWYQVWNLNLQSGQNIWKSRGNFTVLNIYGYDETHDKLYYQATQADDVSVYHVYSNDDCLSCNLIDAYGKGCTSGSARFSSSYSYYALICNGPNPVYTRILDTATNSLVSDWESNSAYRAKLELKLLPSYDFLNVTLADGSTGIAKLALPPGFEKSKKYPLIVNVYAGPNSVRVTNAFTVGYEAFVTTSRDTIYAFIDGRGSGNKGKELLFSVNNDLGDHEVEDQLFVTKWMQDNLPFVDATRTGIWGWSYGGYMTAKIIEKDDDRIFKCGVSVAPVTSWLYYDTIYSERYMGLPTDNPEKYEESSVYNHLDNFKTHKFLLIHGSGDDNVHYQHSLLLAKLLQRADIQFDEQTYTDENHSIGNALPHLYNTIDQFWNNCLNMDAVSELERVI